MKFFNKIVTPFSRMSSLCYSLNIPIPQLIFRQKQPKDYTENDFKQDMKSIDVMNKHPYIVFKQMKNNI